MLRSFRVENHKSIRDEQELLFLPAYDKTRPVVPVAAIFGATASGKSNLLDALAWMRFAVLESFAAWQPGSGVPRVPFRLDPEVAARPSRYCVEIVVGEVRYTYGFEVDDERVRGEWLYTYPHNRRRVIFERDDRSIRFGSTVPDSRALDEQFARQTRANALLLTVVAHSDLAEVQPVYQWFRTAVQFGDTSAGADDDLARRLQNDSERAALLPLIRAADLGIRDVAVKEDQLLAELREGLRSTLLDHVSTDPDTKLAVAMRALRPSSKPADAEATAEAWTRAMDTWVHNLWPVTARDARPSTSLVFYHGSSVPLGIEDQSAGTRSWVRLVACALRALDGGGLLVVDEVDASLHPHLSSQLINLFRDPETNPQGGQLLLTTHDPTLLDEDTLSRDEVWFVEKDADSGVTRLYPLTDFHPRKNENTEGRYLAGAYGAIPVVSDYGFREAIRSSRESDEAA